MIGRPLASDIVEHSAQVCWFIKYAPSPCNDCGTCQRNIIRSCHANWPGEVPSAVSAIGNAGLRVEDAHRFPESIPGENGIVDLIREGAPRFVEEPHLDIHRAILEELASRTNNIAQTLGLDLELAQ